eukprot:6628320-Pyramimonas_sp.AAC.1
MNVRCKGTRASAKAAHGAYALHAPWDLYEAAPRERTRIGQDMMTKKRWANVVQRGADIACARRRGRG